MKLRNGQDCPYCVKARKFLEQLNIPYTYRDLADEHTRSELFARLPGAKTVPQIFIGDRHIGGHDDLVARSVNELQQMIGE